MEPEDLTQFTNDELVDKLGSIQGTLDQAQAELAAVHQEMKRRFPVAGDVTTEV